MLGKKYIGVVHVDGSLFTHPNLLMSSCDCSRSKVLHQLRCNVSIILSKHFIDCHKVELLIRNRLTNEVEYIPF